METKTESKTVTENAGVTTKTQRVVSILSSRGERITVNYDGSTWEGLKKILSEGGTQSDGKSFKSYDLTNLKAVEVASNHTLEHKDAILPEGDFKVYLIPVASKSGAYSRAEVISRIKEAIAIGADKELFKKEGKNYTNISTDVLNEMYEKYSPGTKKAVSKEKATVISDVVESVKSSKSADKAIRMLDGLSHDEKLSVVIGLLYGLFNSKADEDSNLANITEVVHEKKESGESIKEGQQKEKDEADKKQKEEDDKEEKQRLKDEAAEKERKEQEEIDNELDEMKKMTGGFDSNYRVDKSAIRRR